MSSSSENHLSKPDHNAGAAGGKRSRGHVRCACSSCCPRRQASSDDDEVDDKVDKKVDNGPGDKDGGSERPYLALGAKTTSTTSDVDKDNTLRSGITGLSQLSDLPHYHLGSDMANIPDAEQEEEEDSKPSRKTCLCCCSCRCCPRKRRNSGLSPSSVGEKGRAHRCTTCCKKVTAFLFSHVGLSLVIVAYAVLGAFIFMSLEAPYEKNERFRMAEVRRTSVELLWNITFAMNIFYKPNWTAEAEAVFLDFQHKMYTAVKWEGWDGQDVTMETKWSFFGSLLYSITVITTIGYGHITPKTPYGRLATIGYALVGIPLTLLWLANLGTLFGDCFRFLYKHLCYGLMWLCCPSQLSGSRSRFRHRAKHQSLVPAARPGQGPEPGLAGGTGSLTDGSNLRCAEEGEVTYVSSDLAEEGEAPSFPAKKVRVPMLVSLLVITLYLLLGAVLFSMWEKDWDYLIGAYFCFITLSTIGFGDFVPGFGTVWSKEKAIFNACYLIFGLALIAMCFNLMQEEVRAKCSWLARKLRLIDRSCVTAMNNSYSRVGQTAGKAGVAAVVVAVAAEPPCGTVALQGKRSPHKKSRDPSPMSDGRNVYPREFLSVQMEADSFTKADSCRSTPTVTLVRGSGSGGADGHCGGSVSSVSGIGGAGGGLGEGSGCAGDSSSSLGSSSVMVTLIRNTSGSNVGVVANTSNSNSSLNHSGPTSNGPQMRSGVPGGGERGGVGARGAVVVGNGPGQSFAASGKAVSTSAVTRQMPPAHPENSHLLEELPEHENGDDDSSAVPSGPRRPVFVSPCDVTDGLVSLDLDLGVSVDDLSPPASPKMRRRDRSRSPVRGRSRARHDSSSPCGRARASVGEVDIYHDEDDDDTLDASSTASSTDLVKVANALRRERPATSSTSPAESLTTTITSEDTTPTDPHLHHDNGSSSMVTFRPTNAPAHISACALIPTTSRPPSRCQSRARSTSPVLRTFYQQGYDVLGAASKTTGGDAAEAEEEKDAGSAATGAEQRARSAFSKPRPNSSLGQRVPQQQQQQQQPQHVHPKRPSQVNENRPPLRCVSPMPKAARSATPAMMDSPISLSSRTSGEFQRPPPILPKPKNRPPRGASSKPS